MNITLSEPSLLDFENIIGFCIKKKTKNSPYFLRGWFEF